MDLKIRKTLNFGWFLPKRSDFGSRWKFVCDRVEENLQSLGGGLRVNGHPLGGILDPATNPQRPGNRKDEGPKAHALNTTLKKQVKCDH
jgi:hypothetical protein